MNPFERWDCVMCNDLKENYSLVDDSKKHKHTYYRSIDITFLFIISFIVKIINTLIKISCVE